MGPETLAQVLRLLKSYFNPDQYPNLLVGLAVSDDAAVYKISEECALIQTIDFFPPIVNDPYDFGAIAAANSLSDVYAMGGEVTLALNVCCFPEDLSSETMENILRGGADKVAEAGGVLAGGHTLIDKELKYGLAVTGLANPHRILKKANARPGDLMVLTKPLGTGITTTALKMEIASEPEISASVASMKKLNRQAARIFQEVGVQACTDVSGFSLMGHGLEMADNSNVQLSLFMQKIPFLEGAREYAEKNLFPGGTFRNRNCYVGKVRFEASIGKKEQLMLFTPETSGGLLSSVRPNKLDRLFELFERRGHPCWIIGEVKEGRGISFKG